MILASSYSGAQALFWTPAPTISRYHSTHPLDVMIDATSKRPSNGGKIQLCVGGRKRMAGGGWGETSRWEIHDFQSGWREVGMWQWGWGREANVGGKSRRGDARRFRKLLGKEGWEGWVGFLRGATEGFGNEWGIALPCFQILSSFPTVPGMGRFMLL